MNTSEREVRPTLILAAVVATISAATWLVGTHAPWKMDSGELKIFFGIYGVVFAFTVGFVLFQAVEFHRRVKESIDSEINALQDMRDFLFYLDCRPALIRSIRNSLAVYVEKVIVEEWPLLIQDKEIVSDTTEELRGIIKSVHKIEVNNESDQVALRLLVETIRDITTYRTTRVNAATKRIPSSLKALLVTLSICLLLSVCIVPYSIPEIGAVLNGFIALAVTFICLTIFDLDDPFEGSWSISLTPFERLLGTLQPQADCGEASVQ